MLASKTANKYSAQNNKSLERTNSSRARFWRFTRPLHACVVLACDASRMVLAHVPKRTRNAASPLFVLVSAGVCLPRHPQRQQGSPGGIVEARKFRPDCGRDASRGQEGREHACSATSLAQPWLAKEGKPNFQSLSIRNLAGAGKKAEKQPVLFFKKIDPP